MKKMKQLGLLLLFIWPQFVLANVIEVTLHYVGPTDGQIWAGVQQGLTEANLQGQFLGQNYAVQATTIDELKTIPTEQVTAILLATDANTVLDVAGLQQFAQTPVFNLASAANELREACLGNVLNIPLSEQMKQDAIAQWQVKNEDTPVHAQGWHEDFVKFAASQLNTRFTRNHQSKMDDDAWAGWAAIKMLSDSVARTQNTDGDAMLKFLKNDLSFDGQKGYTATFRNSGQLRQIVLLVDEDNNIVAEAPLRGVAGGLDSLGLVSCR
ncbi:ABC transporter substrate-binding protein [Methylophaga thiooxydans]|uniref:Leucine-binding protein domain-containing protein n=1 Tax=Methylophaga thiooxydans DMS010 TaxID=637616 RepID=C0N4C5_9GAMM|nr:hypothetical protein [Methylophaga thiooxydans]EEF80390.1 hypothetical protein MDMS009_1003 [Methylophaga thiooxydans DMS010]